MKSKNASVVDFALTDREEEEEEGEPVEGAPEAETDTSAETASDVNKEAGEDNGNEEV